jgi:processed acidic surface protein
MKHVLSFVLAICLSIGLLPFSAFAIEPNDSEFDAFVESIGWEKQDYIDYLESKDWSLEDFESADELGTPITDESIQPVLSEYEMSREELNALLVEYGDIEEGQDVLDSWFTFTEDLSDTIDFYVNGWEGTAIDEENLQQLLDDYNFETKEALEQFLNENDDSMTHYEFIEDLEMAVDFYVNGDKYLDDFSDLFTDIGLTEEELEKLFSHFETINWEDPVFVDSLMELSDRMMAIEDFETADELSAEQVAEMLDIFNEIQQLFQIQTKYYFVVDGEKQPVSMDTLMSMETTDGQDMIMEIYNMNGELLADMLLTGEMFGSELIQETGTDLVEVEKIVEELPAKSDVKTVKGGKLPITATNHIQNTLIGLTIALAGILLFRRVRVKGN